MLTVVVILIGVLVVLRIASAVRDRQMRSTRGVDLTAETFEDRMHAANRAMRPHGTHAAWTDPGSSGGSLWYEGGGDAGAGGDGSGGGGDAGGGGDFGGDDNG